MLATPPYWASSKKALIRANIKPPVELVVADLKFARCELEVNMKSLGDSHFILL